MRQGRLTPEEAAVHPRRHQLTRTLGLDDDPTPDIFEIAAEPGDRLLLCSDGLSNELTDDEIADLASAPRSLDEAVSTLVESANRHGGRDNITAVLVEFVDAVVAPVTDEVVAPAFTTNGESVSPPAAEEAAATVGAHARPSRRRRPRFTWRTALFILLLAGVVTLAYEVLSWYDHNSYYLAEYNGHVAVYQGQQGGLLWFKPKLVVLTTVPLSQVRTIDLPTLAQTINEPNLAAALRQADLLHHYWQIQHPVHVTTTTTTSTTTTTVPGTQG